MKWENNVRRLFKKKSIRFFFLFCSTFFLAQSTQPLWIFFCYVFAAGLEVEGNTNTSTLSTKKEEKLIYITFERKTEEKNMVSH